ncbi:hypothetical protein [Rhodoferax antarcticus]|nr:hypothetical protein [Rhodoferax antarcticus]APW46702.1 hypothetical protein RA876_10355 [Rhodoferax antarcticus]
MDAVNLPQLIALSDYTAPTMPTEQAFRAIWARLKRRMSGPEDPLLQHSGLDQASLAMIDDLANPPDSGPLLQAFEEQFGEWSRDADALPRLRTIVIPPCDTTGTLAIWAQTHGHALLPEPSRIDLTSLAGTGKLPDLTGDGLLVIPRLEQWFLRERNGLHTVRSLLSELARTERRCLVGCDSWAWRFIVKGASADLALPRPQTFEPFDARRLRDWFATLARDSGGVTATFRLTENGEDVLACDDDGEPRNAHLRQLAARSGGIPWVAWHLWRASLKVSVGEEPLSDRAAGATAGDARTVWVVGIDDVELPPSNEDRSLLVLQALLIHGGLTSDEIDAVLPTTGEPDMLAALVTTGHLQREQGSGWHHVSPTAYPPIRKALKAAGFPSGAI